MNLRLASSLVVACVVVFTMQTAGAAPRAVIELFTSQGCSSCPAADKLMAEFAHDPSLIPMSLAVDYWDYLGWKDTLALHGHSNRQRAYAGARGDREVYTPQAVINGVVHALGSDKAAIEHAITQTRKDDAPLTLPVVMTMAGDHVTVNVPASKDEQGQGEVWLCPITKSVSVAIGRGENRGHTLTYTNVVRRWIKLGSWSGKAETFNVPLKDFQTGEIDKVAVVVQHGVAAAPKVMLGAAEVAVR